MVSNGDQQNSRLMEIELKTVLRSILLVVGFAVAIPETDIYEVHVMSSIFCCKD